MAEQAQVKQSEPWAVRLWAGAFLDGAPGAIQSNSGVLDTTTTEAKRARVALSLQRDGVLVRYEATKSVGGQAPTTKPRTRLFPWSRVDWVDLPAEVGQSTGK